MTSGRIELAAYQIEDPSYHSDRFPYWEVYDNSIDPPDILTEDEFGEWINDPYTRHNYDVHVFTLQSYYEGLFEESKHVD
jgi:hypothetical protein